MKHVAVAHLIATQRCVCRPGPGTLSLLDTLKELGVKVSPQMVQDKLAIEGKSCHRGENFVAVVYRHLFGMNMLYKMMLIKGSHVEEKRSP